MTSDIKVSIIIPVYNIQDVIHKSVESLLNQSLKELEFIFVSDGLDKDRMAVIEEYAQKDSRIKVLYNDKNRGSGYSRNHGIEHAQGEYLAFFDPDDLVDLDFYEKLYVKAKESDFDIVKTERVRLEADKKEYSKLNNYLKEVVASKKDLFPVFTSEHTTAIYKRQIIMDNNIRYGSTRRAQDTTFLLRMCLYAKNIAFVEETYYYYLINKTSMTQNKNLNYYFDNIDAIREKFEFLNSKTELFDEDVYYDYIYGMMKYIISLYAILLKDAKLVTNRRDVFEKIHDVSMVIIEPTKLLCDTEVSYFIKNNYTGYMLYNFMRKFFCVEKTKTHIRFRFLFVSLKFRRK